MSKCSKVTNELKARNLINWQSTSCSLKLHFFGPTAEFLVLGLMFR